MLHRKKIHSPETDASDFDYVIGERVEIINRRKHPVITDIN